MTALRLFVAGNRWLLARRGTQVATLALFLLGPWAGWWWVQGTFAASTWFDTVLLLDPYVLAQLLAGGHAPAAAAVSGSLAVLGFYAAIGGRAYCAWFCPVNLVADAAAWLRAALDVRGGWHPPRPLRRWILFMTLVVSGITGAAAWEWVNPVTLLQRSLLFDAGHAWIVIVALFLLDVFFSARCWCGRLCPVGAFYGLVGSVSPVRVVAEQRATCTDCGACFRHCPEPQVIGPVLKMPGSSPVPVMSGDCTRCGRCIDVCPAGIFKLRSHIQDSAPAAGPGR